MAHITISDSNRGSRISLNVREQMTVCPPPNTTPEGDVLSYPESYVLRYSDLRAMKQAYPIYIEEEEMPNHLLWQKMHLWVITEGQQVLRLLWGTFMLKEKSRDWKKL